MPKEKQDIETKIAEASTPAILKSLKTEAIRGGKESLYNDRMEELGETVEQIKKTGKKAAEKAGASKSGGSRGKKHVDALTDNALVEAETVLGDLDKEIKGDGKKENKEAPKIHTFEAPKGSEGVGAAAAAHLKGHVKEHVAQIEADKKAADDQKKADAEKQRLADEEKKKKDEVEKQRLIDEKKKQDDDAAEQKRKDDAEKLRLEQEKQKAADQLLKDQAEADRIQKEKDEADRVQKEQDDAAAALLAAQGIQPGPAPSNKPGWFDRLKSKFSKGSKEELDADVTMENPQSLEQARNAYFKKFVTYQEKRGWVHNAYTKVVGGEMKAEDIKKSNPKLAAALEASKDKYNDFLIAEGNKMLNEGKSQAEIFQALIINEREARVAQEIVLVPENVKAMLLAIPRTYGKLFENKYFSPIYDKIASVVPEAYRQTARENIPRVIRATFSAGIATGAVLATAHVSAAVALAYGGAKLKATLGWGVGGGQALVSAKNLAVGSMGENIKDVEKKFQESDEVVKFAQAGTPLDMAVLTKMQGLYNDRMIKEDKVKRNHLIFDSIARMGTMYGAAMAMGHDAPELHAGPVAGTHDTAAPGTSDNTFVPTSEADNLHHTPMGNAGPHMVNTDAADKITHAVSNKADGYPVDHANVAPTDAHETAQQAAEKFASHYTIKEIPKVEFSSAGGLQTALDLKHAVGKAYEGISDDKIPPSALHILRTDHETLAKEFDWYRPGAADHNESISVLKGSYVELNKTGDIVSHSLHNAHGVADNETLLHGDGDFNQDTDGPIGSGAENNENYFHYGGNGTGAGHAHGHDAPIGMHEPKIQEMHVPKTELTSGHEPQIQELGKLDPVSAPPLPDHTQDILDGYSQYISHHLHGHHMTLDEWAAKNYPNGQPPEPVEVPNHPHHPRIPNHYRPIHLTQGGYGGQYYNNYNLNNDPNVDVHPIGNPAHPSEIGGWQVTHFGYGALDHDALNKMLEQHIPKDIDLEKYAGTAMAPTMKLIDHLKDSGVTPEPGQSIGSFLETARNDHPGMIEKWSITNEDDAKWLGSNGLLG